MNNSINEKIENTEKNLILSEKIIWLIMIIISLIHALICISPGILSSYVTEIKNEFILSDEKFGIIGTIYGFGALIGSFVFTLVIEIVNNKYLLCGMLITNCFCNFAFFFSIQYYSLLMSRFISGFASVFCFTLFPIWVERFAMKKWVNFMQTTVQVSNTLGGIIGYFFYLIMGRERYKLGFFVESLSILILTFILITIPSKYYNKKYDKKENYKISEFNISTDTIEMKDMPNGKIISSQNKEIEIKEIKGTVIKDIICNLPFVLCTLYRGNRIFIFESMNFWYSDYLQTTLMETNANAIFWSYSITMVFASLIGNILGGVILNKIGGTKSRYSFIAMLILQFVSVIFGLLSPFTYSVFYFTILMSSYILINSTNEIISISASFAVVPENMAGKANGIFSFIANLIGFLPCPYVFGLLKTIFKKGSIIIIILMIYGLFGCIELIIADLYMRFKKIKLYKDKFFTLKEENKKSN